MDKDEEPGDEEIDSGIQSEKSKTPEGEDVNAIQTFADSIAKEVVNEPARNAAEQVAAVNDGEDNSEGEDQPKCPEDDVHEEQAEPHSEELEEDPERFESVKEEQNKADSDEIDEQNKTENNNDQNDAANYREHETKDTTEANNAGDEKEATTDDNSPRQDKDEVTARDAAGTDYKAVEEDLPHSIEADAEMSDEGEGAEAASGEKEAEEEENTENLENTGATGGVEPVEGGAETDANEENHEEEEVERSETDPTEVGAELRVDRGDSQRQNSVVGELETPEAAKRTLSAIPEVPSSKICATLDTEAVEDENGKRHAKSVDGECHAHAMP